MGKTLCKILLVCLLLSGCTNKTVIEKMVLSIDENQIQIAPGNYDKDAHESFKDEITWIEISDSVKFYDVNKKTIIHENGKKESKQTKNKITREQFEEIVDLGSAYVYLEINNEGIVTKITVFGELIIYE